MPIFVGREGSESPARLPGARPGQPPLLLSIHPWCGSVEFLAPRLEHFASWVRSVPVDLRGRISSVRRVVVSDSNRILRWEACVNTRDLGGLPTRQGPSTRRGAVVRSDNPAYLTQAGWATVVALRTIGTADDEPAEIPNEVEFVRVDLEDSTDIEFRRRWVDNGLWGTPLHFTDALARWPERAAAAMRAVARARPGGVLVACGRGCDRTGFVTMLLLHLVGVPVDEIAADYALSVEQLRGRDPDWEPKLYDTLTVHGTTIASSIDSTLSGGDVAAALRGGGLGEEDLGLLQLRLVDGC